MNQSPRVALFDLDGTLVDSAPDIAHAVDTALRVNGLTPVGESRVREYIGNGARRLIHRAIARDRGGEVEEARFAPVYRAFLAAYENQVFDLSRLYPGTVETLSALRDNGWSLACVTNKPTRFTRAVLAAAELDHYFGSVVAGDTLPQQKPAPEPLQHALVACGAGAGSAVMIGDSLIDVEAAMAADLPIVAVDYGYAGGADLAAHGVAAVISTLTELPPLLDTLVG